MSAFVVEPKTINRVISYLRSGLNGNGRISGPIAVGAQRILQKIEWDFETEEQAADLGQAMYNLNINAVGQRYPDANETNIPGCYKDGKLIPYEYEWEASLLGPSQVLKSIDCWKYQCLEGNVPEMKLFVAFKQIADLIARRIATSTPSYERADWG